MSRTWSRTGSFTWHSDIGTSKFQKLELLKNQCCRLCSCQISWTQEEWTFNFSHPKSKVGNTVGKNCQIEFIILREIIFASPKDIFLKFDGFFLEFDLQIKLCQNSKNYEIYWMNVPMQSTRFSNKKWIEFKEYLTILLLPYFNLKKCEVMCWYFTIL